jgi:Tfp pilus assembly protein PilF
MTRYLRLLGLLLSVVILAVSLQAQRKERPEGPTNLQIYIMFENSRPAGAHLRIDLANAGGIPVAQGFTDDSGRTMLQAPGAGGYIIKVAGETVQKGASESVEVYPCPAVQCTRTVQVQVKPAAAAAQSTASSGNAAVTSAAALRIPDNARKPFEQGMNAWQKKDYQQAANKFEKAVAAYPEYDTAYNNLGVMYAHLGQNDKALAAFRRAVELNDKNADADRNLARMLIRQKDFPHAEELLKKAMTVQPPDAATLTMLAVAEIQDGKLDDAIKDAQRVNAMPHEGYSAVHYVAGEALEEKHQYAEASTEYNLYLKENPNGPDSTEVRSALQRLSTASAAAAPVSQ